MNLKYIYTGSWFPRTKLHLREIYNFLKYRQTELTDGKAELEVLAHQMSIKHVEYHGGLFDTVLAHTDSIKIQYDEDGLMLLKIDAENWPADNKYLDDFYQQKLTPFLYLLFSKGAPSLEKVRTGLRVRPVVVVATEMTKDEMFEFFRQADDCSHSDVTRKDLSVHFGDKIILIVTKKPDSELVQYLVRFYTFFREYEAYLYRFMLIDRKIWDNINDIREGGAIKGRDLPNLRDQLILFKRDTNVIKLRLAQMNNYLDERQSDVELKKLKADLDFFKAYRFEKMESVHAYMMQLVQATENYVDDAINLLQLLYQENQQNQVGTLQMIFLIGTVANIISLGLLNPKLDPWAIVNFGGLSVGIGCLIYWASNWVFKRIRVNHAISLLEKPNKREK